MYFNDITPYEGIQLAYMRDIEPRRIELAKLMGTSKQIKVRTNLEPVHTFQAGSKFGLCYCDSCYGDFSNAQSASGDE